MLVVGLLAGLLTLVSSVAVPFLLALLLAYCLDPAVQRLERLRLPRSVAIGLVFGIFLSLAIALLLFLVPAMSRELVVIQQALPEYASNLVAAVPQPVLERLGISTAGNLQTLLEQTLGGVKNLSLDVVKQVLVFVSRAFTTTIGFVVAVLGYFIIPIYLYYLLVDLERLKSGFFKLIPPRDRPGAERLVREISQVLGAFLRGQLSVCMVLAILYSLGLVLIGVDLALVIGIGSGLAFIIPYLGTILGILIAGTMAAVKFQDLLHPLMVVGWFALVQALEGIVITPRLVGKSVGLHPMMIILAVLIGGELFGFFGLLLAVPVTAALNVLFGHLLGAYRSSDFYLARASEEGHG